MMYDIPILLSDSIDIAVEMIKLSEDYFEDKVTTAIGLSVVEHEYNKFSRIIEQIKNKKKEDKYFNGICIFGNHLYSDWKSFKGENLNENEEDEQSTENRQSTENQQ